MTSDHIDHLVDDARTRLDFPGIAVGVVKDGEVVHVKGYGVSSLASGKRVDRHTQFTLASVSKAFTTTALAILVDRGEISWKDRVIDYIPEFTMYNSYVLDNFIIEDLLTHRSGLGLGVGDLMFKPDDNDFTIDDILASFQHFEPVSAFRTQYDYDNLLYIVAGELIKRVTGQSWKVFVRDNILVPLEMDNSFSEISLITDKGNLASPHVEKDDAVLEPIENFKRTGNGAASGIFSNVDDFCKWMLVHLNRGKYGNDLEKELFSEERQREMWKPYISFVSHPTEPYFVNFSGYGLGWVLTDVQGHFVAYHSGGLPGISTQIMLVPDMDLGIVVLANRGWSVEPISFAILDSYLGVPDQHWVAKMAEGMKGTQQKTDSVSQNVWKTVAISATDRPDPKNFLGIYEDPWFGKVAVFEKGELLWIKSYRAPKLNGELQYYKGSTFAVKWEYQDMNADAFVHFILDEKGIGQKISMEGISPDIDFSFDFQDLDFSRCE